MFKTLFIISNFLQINAFVGDTPANTTIIYTQQPQNNYIQLNFDEIGTFLKGHESTGTFFYKQGVYIRDNRNNIPSSNGKYVFYIFIDKNKNVINYIDAQKLMMTYNYQVIIKVINLRKINKFQDIRGNFYSIVLMPNGEYSIRKDDGSIVILKNSLNEIVTL